VWFPQVDLKRPLESDGLMRPHFVVEEKKRLDLLPDRWRGRSPTDRDAVLEEERPPREAKEGVARESGSVVGGYPLSGLPASLHAYWDST
jgi:hypothetical protein